MNYKDSDEYKKYREKWDKGELVHLDIEINNTCNHACVMCWHSKEGGPGFDLHVMKFDKIKELLDRGREVGLQAVKLNLRGEPTLHPKLVECVEYANKVGYVDIMINTHGARLVSKYKDTNMFDALKKAGIRTIIISLGNMNKGEYMALHQVGEKEYDELWKALRYIHSKQGDIIIKLNCHISDNSYFDKESLEKEFPNFTPVWRYIENREGEHISVVQENRTRKKQCPHMHRRLTIQAEGQIYPCCISYNSPESIRLAEDFDFDAAMVERARLIDDYANGRYREACINCPSNDVWLETS